MAGGGNDFLLFEADGRKLSEEDRRRIELLCRRGLSVGADGALFLTGGESGTLRLDYYNSDGGLASFCANGTRCAARYAVRRRLVPGDTAVLATGWAPISARVVGSAVTLLLPPLPLPGDPLAISAPNLPATAIPMHVGVPHLVVFVKDSLSDLPIAQLAPPLRRHPLLPEGANVDFVQISGPDSIAVRTFERGVEAETLSCGSGVVAAAIVAHRHHKLDLPIVCGTKSRVDFMVSFRQIGDRLENVILTGDAREIFEGTLEEEAWQA